MAEMVGDERNDDVLVVSEQSSAIMDVEMERQKLRRRWELASVLNFLKVVKLLFFLILFFNDFLVIVGIFSVPFPFPFIYLLFLDLGIAIFAST